MICLNHTRLYSRRDMLVQALSFIDSVPPRDLHVVGSIGDSTLIDKDPHSASHLNPNAATIEEPVLAQLWGRQVTCT
jgi:hypothetical protein